METRLLTHEPLITWHPYPITRLPPPPLINYCRIPSNSNDYVSLCIGPPSQAWKLIQKQRQQKIQNKKRGGVGVWGDLSLPVRGILLVFSYCIQCVGTVQCGWHPGVACFDTYSRLKPTVCLPHTPPGLTQPLTCMIKGNREGGGE